MSYFFRILAVTGLFCGCLPLAAHHSTASYDKTKTVPMKGVVVAITWMNPHAGMILDGRDSNGKTTQWVVEMAAPVVLMSRGWKKGDVKPGDEITIDAWLLKKGGDDRAFARFVHLPDGRIISGLGSWDCGSAAQEGCTGMFQLAPEAAK
jgi:hypothetical protein